MGFYIEKPEALLARTWEEIQPPDGEIQAALRTLSRSPVVGYPGFMEAEVRLIGCYRRNIRPKDIFWAGIVNGHPEAWLSAVHEAAELDALDKMGAEPFNTVKAQTHFGEAHLLAVVVEVRFLRAWAHQLGIEISEAAIERSNPIRGQFLRQHRESMTILMQRMGWMEPDEEELQRAEAFWKRILTEARP